MFICQHGSSGAGSLFLVCWLEHCSSPTLGQVAPLSSGATLLILACVLMKKRNFYCPCWESNDHPTGSVSVASSLYRVG